MAKPRKPSAPAAAIAGFTPAEWKQHMDTDEDWTERLEGAPEPSVREVIGALDHEGADVRALACNLAYALGVDGLGAHADAAVERLAALAQGDKNAKVRSRARLVHESLAGELERAAVRRELPWLAAFDPSATDAAFAAGEDPRDAVRLQVYLWWANATTLDPQTAAKATKALKAAVDRESDPVLRQAGEIALARLRG